MPRGLGYNTEVIFVDSNIEAFVVVVKQMSVRNVLDVFGCCHVVAGERLNKVGGYKTRCNIIIRVNVGH